ncbi:transcriptional regulator [Motiliproteus sp. MSK22-1]|uniref:helix-turn-helix transcriptional regulator n=1 Tax=Motiliproteus sp. MSK22-1 TaxID=1897630 RepID=UPI000976327F|nr:PAS domain-containing protein [Motiliproteus sp. MSK22-1]OMH39237.1 hypothetical protein BGP75_03845 [Motiliproteus sp. MSK22-1]
MSDLVGRYSPICQAIAQLIPGQIEVVLHDFKTEKMVYVENPISIRKVGESSLVDLAQLEADVMDSSLIGPYRRVNSDGSRLKSISVVLRETDGTPEGLLCINLRLEQFEAVKQLMSLVGYTQKETGKDGLFSQDWRETVNECVRQVLVERGTTLVAAKRDDRLAITAALDTAEIFQIRGSADYVAQVIGVSRATLYDMLKEIKNSQNPKEQV